MRKPFIIYILILSILLSSCTSSHIKSFEKFNLQIEDSVKENSLIVSISGYELNSALSIEKYEIKYGNNKIFININESLRNTGMSVDYYIQFLMSKDVKEIYINNQLFWTNSVESYFNNQKMSFPLNINKSITPNYNSIENNTELSKNEKMSVENFMQFFSKKITFEKCKKWKNNAVAFNISNFGIFEAAGKKYYCVSVDAYLEDSKVYDNIKKIENMDISVLHNILLFDYDTYDELGWVF